MCTNSESKLQLSAGLLGVDAFVEQVREMWLMECLYLAQARPGKLHQGVFYKPVQK